MSDKPFTVNVTEDGQVRLNLERPPATDPNGPERLYPYHFSPDEARTLARELKRIATRVDGWSVMDLSQIQRLAVLLDDSYDESYHVDREKRMREFGGKYKEELQSIMDDDHTLDELGEKAGLDSVGHWARFIREGMEGEG